MSIILTGKRELVVLLSLSSLYLVILVVWFFLTMPRDGLQIVTVVFPGHTHLLILLAIHRMIHFSLSINCFRSSDRSKKFQLHRFSAFTIG